MYKSKNWHYFLYVNLSLLAMSIFLSSQAVAGFVLSTVWIYRVRTALIPDKKKISLSVSSKSYFQKTGQLQLYKKILLIEYYIFFVLGCFVLFQDIIKALK